jgi:hypothetical protein
VGSIDGAGKQNGIMYRILVVKSLEKCPFGRLRGGWEINMKMSLWETGCEGGIFMELTQDGFQWTHF